MIDCIGWIYIGCDDETSFNIGDREIIKQIDNFLIPFRQINQVFNIIPINYTHYLQIALGHNKDIGYSQMIFDIMVEVGKLAKESHGLVYIHLSDHPTHWDEYIVYKMAVGKVTIEKDTLLSPCSLIIDPEWS